MSSKRLFSWSRRQSTVEPYYKTGGLLPIESISSEPSNITEAKDAQKARRRPSDLTIIPPDHQQFTSSPLSSPYNGALVSSSSNLMAIFNDMLRSPTLSASACPRSASVHKPLPTRPRSSSLPSTPDLPVELPGSLLQQNQGFPYFDIQDPVPSRPTSQNVRRGTHPPEGHFEDEGDVVDLLHLFPEPLNHSKSVPSLKAGYREGAMKSSRAGAASSAHTNSKPHIVQHRKALSDMEWRTISAPSSAYYGDNGAPTSAHPDSNAVDRSLVEIDALLQPSSIILEVDTPNRPAERRPSRRDDLGAFLTHIPTTARGKVTETSQTTDTQDQTIATLRSHFKGLKTSHEAHVSSLAEAHAAEVASLRNYTKLLEEQLAQRSVLHHDVTPSAEAQLVSNNNPLFGVDTARASTTPSRKSSQYTADTSASSTRSYRSAPEKQQYSPARSQDNADMESLKRKLSTTRRPQNGDRNLLPELNQYKQNNAALQTQISSLMAKLNESKKSEKATRATLEDVEQRCAKVERQFSEAQQLASSAQALQNTIDHLENRLELANSEKLDAQEELFNMRALKSPFDAQFPDLHLPTQDAHESMDTIFSIGSQHDYRHDSNAAVSGFVTHVGQLQDEIRQKDSYIAELQSDSLHLRHVLDQMHRQCDEINLQLDIQNELLGKTKETDAHIEQLQSAVLDREAVIADKEKSVRTAERHLEHHKLLLQAEIRKNATTSRYFADNNKLPELTTLATKVDVDRWIQRLNQRLRKANPAGTIKEARTAAEVQIEDLRNEIDFYVREIIYYKLDIRGYKSDIKKLNKAMAQLGNYANRPSDLDSDTSSLRLAPTPNRARFLSTTPDFRGSGYPSPASAGPISTNIGSARDFTPPASTTADSPETSPLQTPGDYGGAAPRNSMASQSATQIIDMSTAHGDDLERYALAIGDTGPPFLNNAYLDTRLNEIRPTLERDDSDASTVRPVVPISRFSRDLPSGPPSPRPERVCHSRVGSTSSTRSHSQQHHSTTARLERSMSSSSSTGIPFVIAMSSPNNPAIAVAAKNMPATRPLRSASATSRAGVDGTMASHTPLSSPTSVASLSTVASAVPSGHKRKLSLSFRKQENEAPSTSSHSRGLSGGSIRSAMRWTKGSSKEKEKEGQMRKDSMGMPQLLDSPVGLERQTN
ncbi:hypothetical protein C7974DRAFT_389411 [Boeremia exigua]|uniref:uncharacterized protein n=1 Tax=Boeremia exigua TaxID=749465 RepID=UPI001E8E371C|nr:uncharacterized protein C7974DRAFT_389411 [Boeremia exigua]KAH6637388.1 hypothetical protein C7974DRAFT_389411 [Boeremia exigua]